MSGPPFIRQLERLVFEFTAVNAGDQEASTKTITATSKPASPDYTYNIPSGSSRLVPTDERFIPKRFVADLEVTIDSMTATHLYASVEFDDVEAIDGATADFTGAGASQRKRKDSVESEHLDGVSTIKIYFWVDSGNAVLSLVIPRYGYGTCSTSYVAVMELGPFKGRLTIASMTSTSGDAGTSHMLPTLSDSILLGSPSLVNATTQGLFHGSGDFLCEDKVYLWLKVASSDGFLYLNTIEIMFEEF